MRVSRITFFIKATRFVFIVSAIRGPVHYRCALSRSHRGRFNARASTLQSMWPMYFVRACTGGMPGTRRSAGRLRRRSRQPRGRCAVARRRTRAHVAWRQSGAPHCRARESGFRAAFRRGRERCCAAARVGRAIAASHALRRLAGVVNRQGSFGAGCPQPTTVQFQVVRMCSCVFALALLVDVSRLRETVSFHFRPTNRK